MVICITGGGDGHIGPSPEVFTVTAPDDARFGNGDSSRLATRPSHRTKQCSNRASFQFSFPALSGGNAAPDNNRTGFQGCCARPVPNLKGRSMYEVTEIPFEEISIEIAGVYVGLFSGSAGVDTDGAVVTLSLDGWQNGEQSLARLEVNRHQNTRRFDDVLAIVLADEIQDQLQPEINEALTEWADASSVREPDFEVA